MTCEEEFGRGRSRARAVDAQSGSLKVKGCRRSGCRGLRTWRREVALALETQVESGLGKSLFASVRCLFCIPQTHASQGSWFSLD